MGFPLFVALVGCSTSTPSHSSPAGRVTASPLQTTHVELSRAVPADFRPLSVSFISRLHGFALGEARCATVRCLVLLTTRDGGRHWDRLPDPPVLAGDNCLGPGCVEQLRFASAEVGYLFGPGFLMTHDGGQTWTAQRGPQVRSLEPGGGSVLRVSVSDRQCSHGDALETSVAGGTTWSPVHLPPLVAGCNLRLLRIGPATAYVLGTHLAVSTDLGRRWRLAADPCRRGETVFGVAAAIGVFASLCFGHVQPHGAQYAWVRISTDEGRTFGRSRLITADAAGTALGISVASAQRVLLSFGGPHVTTIALLNAESGQYVNDGVMQYGPSGDFIDFVGFQDAETGWIVSSNGGLSTTTDGGLTWRVDPFDAG